MKPRITNNFGNKKIIYYFFVIVIASSIILLTFFFLSTKFLAVTQKRNFEYSEVDINKPLKGKVIGVYEDKGITFLTLTDSLKVWIPHSRNYDYKEPFLNIFIKIGDSLEKKPNNDTLHIIRKSDHYYFIISKFINQ
jgi:hypothetical protein